MGNSVGKESLEGKEQNDSSKDEPVENKDKASTSKFTHDHIKRICEVKDM